MSASSLIEVARRQMAAHTSVEMASLPAVLAGRLTDPGDPRGVRHALVAGVGCGYTGMLAIAEAATGWNQEVSAG